MSNPPRPGTSPAYDCHMGLTTEVEGICRNVIFFLNASKLAWVSVVHVPVSWPGSWQSSYLLQIVETMYCLFVCFFQYVYLSVWSLVSITSMIWFVNNRRQWPFTKPEIHDLEKVKDRTDGVWPSIMYIPCVDAKLFYFLIFWYCVPIYWASHFWDLSHNRCIPGYPGT